MARRLETGEQRLEQERDVLVGLPTACSPRPTACGWGWRMLNSNKGSYLYGPGGQLLESYRAWNDTTDYVYFGGRLLYTLSNGEHGYTAVTRMYSDRLGSTRATQTQEWIWNSSTTRNYYPYGEEIGSTANDQYKFASTYRDSATGLDYAVNRYYASGTGRFLTVDPDKNSARLGSPASWNQYGYSHGDPVNLADPRGLDPCSWDPSTNTLDCKIGSPGGGGGGGGGGSDGMEVVLPTDTVGEGVGPGGSGVVAPPQSVPLAGNLASTLSNNLANVPGWLLGSRMDNDDCNQSVLNPLSKSLGFNLDSFVSYLRYGGTFYDGTRSTAPVAGTITSTAAANAMYGPGATIQGVFSQGGTNAITSITASTLTVYLDPGAVSSDATRNMSFLFHEGLHGYGGTVGGTSFFDSDIQTALFGAGSSEVGRPSVNITNFIQQHCFK